MEKFGIFLIKLRLVIHDISFNMEMENDSKPPLLDDMLSRTPIGELQIEVLRKAESPVNM